ncbi:MAG: hypothetical protein J3R72DRAFT_523558 [Linnemannia gamsii]|nr:MAG: hypothetical protein J3R72DRAFT_523558 [Linnemannia gamsii]
MSDNNQRKKSASKSPPILTPEHLDHSRQFHERNNSQSASPPATTTVTTPPAATSNIPAERAASTAATSTTTKTTKTTTATATTGNVVSSTSTTSRILVSTEELGFTKPPRHPSQNEERLASYIPLTQVTSSSESAASALHVNSSDLPSLNESPATLSNAPLPANSLSQRASGTQHEDYDLYHGDHPTQHVEVLQFTESASPSFGPQSLQALPEDVTAEEAENISFAPTPNREGSFVDPNDSLSSSNKSSDSSFHKANRSSESQQSNSSSRSNRSGSGVSPGGTRSSGSQQSQQSQTSQHSSHSQHSSQHSQQSQYSQHSQHHVASQSRRGARNRSGSTFTPPGIRSSGSPGTPGTHSSLDSQASLFSQVSNLSFSNIEHSTPRDARSQLSTPSNPSPGDSQGSPLGTYSTNPGSQQYPTQPSQGPVRSPTVTVQSSRQGQRSSQEWGSIHTVDGRTTERYTVVEQGKTITRDRVIETSTAVEQDDSATQPLDFFGPDPRPDEVEASFEAEEVADAQESSAPAHKNLATDDDNEVVGEITSQDIDSPFEMTPSPSRSSKRTERDEDKGGEEAEGPAHVEYLSSDDEEVSKASAHNSTLHLHLTQDLSTSNSSFPDQHSLRSRPAPKTNADKILPPSIIQPESTPATSQQLEEPITTQSFDPQQLNESSLPPSQSSLVEEPFATPKRKSRSARSPRPSASQLEEVPSSQNSGSSLSGSSSYSRRMRPLEAEFKAELKADPKRRKVLSSDKLADVPASVEDEFWESSVTESQAKVTITVEKTSSRSSSRPNSQDASSFLDDQPLEADVEGRSGLADKGKGKAVDKASKSSPSSAAGPSSRTRSATSPSKSSPRPRTSPPSELRRRGSGRGSAPTTPIRRNPVRRLYSGVESLRSYKTNDRVWARWEKGRYYAGVVQSQDENKYNVLFLDDNDLECEGGEMRPLKFQLGTEVMARKTEKQRRPATLEGVQLTRDVTKSRVDIRFKDKTEANVALGEICLTSEMMDKLDLHMDWDTDGSRTIAADQSYHSESFSSDPSTPLSQRSSSISVPPGTPKKIKGLARNPSAGALTPRRGRSEAVPSAEIVPTTNGEGIFKGLRFVVTLMGREDLYDGIMKKIETGGGKVEKNFPSVIERYPSGLSNVMLISYTYLRSSKYCEALALNVPRLSYRWIESCVKTNQLQPHQHYKLATGYSNELETVVFNEPLNDLGIFDDLQIGICGAPIFMKKWKRPLQAAGATVVHITAEKGPMSCNYVVFENLESFETYCQDSTIPLRPLAREWLVQCLVNQRVLAIHGHPSYTALDNKEVADKKDTSDVSS